MSFRLTTSEADVSDPSKTVTAQGHAESAQFVRQVTGAPQAIAWKKGMQVKAAAPGGIARGTAIATFDDKGAYPHDAHGHHAAIYLSHDARGILVLDRSSKDGQVLQHTISFLSAGGTRRGEDGATYHVIEQK